jgi:hypothetical protein
MKSRDAVIRLKRFEVEEKRRKVADIEATSCSGNGVGIRLQAPGLMRRPGSSYILFALVWPDDG